MLILKLRIEGTREEVIEYKPEDEQEFYSLVALLKAVDFKIDNVRVNDVPTTLSEILANAMERTG
jgi:hypothetical protein